MSDASSERIAPTRKLGTLGRYVQHFVRGLKKTSSRCSPASPGTGSIAQLSHVAWGSDGTFPPSAPSSQRSWSGAGCRVFDCVTCSLPSEEQGRALVDDLADLELAESRLARALVVPSADRPALRRLDREVLDRLPAGSLRGALFRGLSHVVSPSFPHTPQVLLTCTPVAQVWYRVALDLSTTLATVIPPRTDPPLTGLTSRSLTDFLGAPFFVAFFTSVLLSFCSGPEPASACVRPELRRPGEVARRPSRRPVGVRRIRLSGPRLPSGRFGERGLSGE